jgi:1-acyl-sn-glycerol-3-phosphate acyltransferase
LEASVLTTAVSAGSTPARARLGPVPSLLRSLLRWLLRRLFAFELVGLERIPQGRYIVAANHPGWIETLALAAFLPANGGLRTLASRRATIEIGWRRVILNLADVVLPLDIEGREARPAIRAAVEYLRRGAAISIFPEDRSEPTRPDGALRPLRRGVAFLARASESPVVPVGVPDTRELWRGRHLRINIGEPLAPPRERAEDERFLAELAVRIEALRPPVEPLPAQRSWTWLSKLF